MIYLIVDEHRHFCKIGFTELEIEQRLLILQTGNPQKLFLVGLIDGDEEKETDIHNMFVRFHKRGEWFFYHQTILDYFYGQPDYYVSSVVDIIPLSFKKKTGKKEQQDKKSNFTKVLNQLSLPASAYDYAVYFDSNGERLIYKLPTIVNSKGEVMKDVTSQCVPSNDNPFQWQLHGKDVIKARISDIDYQEEHLK